MWYSSTSRSGGRSTSREAGARPRRRRRRRRRAGAGARPASVLVRVQYSCVERRHRADRDRAVGHAALPPGAQAAHHAKKALELAKDQGFVRTTSASRGRLSAGTPTGYSAAGFVVEASATTSTGFAVGDRVACAGAGIANHAEVIAVPVNLAVRVPDGPRPRGRVDGDARRDRDAGRTPRRADARRDGRGGRARQCSGS